MEAQEGQTETQGQAEALLGSVSGSEMLRHPSAWEAFTFQLRGQRHL